MAYVNLPAAWREHGKTAARALIGKAEVTKEIQVFMADPVLSGNTFSWLVNSSNITAGPRGLNNGKTSQGITYTDKQSTLAMISANGIVDIADNGGSTETTNAALIQATELEIAEAVYKELTRQFYFGDSSKAAVDGGLEFDGVFTRVPVADARSIDAGGAVAANNTSILLSRADKKGLQIKTGANGFRTTKYAPAAVQGSNDKIMEGVPIFGNAEAGLATGADGSLITVRNIGLTDTTIGMPFVDAIRDAIVAAQAVDVNSAPNLLFCNALVKDKMDRAVQEQNNNGGIKTAAEYLSVKIELSSHLPYTEDPV